MIQVTLTPEDYNLADLVQGLEAVSRSFMPSTARAFKTSSTLMQYAWKKLAASTLTSSRGNYVKSIKVRSLSPFQYEIYTDHPVAEVLEHGAKEYDMKKTHPFGKKSRVVKEDVRRKGQLIRKKGDPYLIVPFRHGVPKALRMALPAKVYQELRQLIAQGGFALSSVKVSPKKSKKIEPNYRGELIPRAVYQWGSRLQDAPMDHLEGMVVMNVPSGPTETRSQYMTFRVISVNSPAHKWIQPMRPGHEFVQKVVEATAEPIKDLISRAIAKDLGVS